MTLLCKSNSCVLFVEANGHSSYCSCAFMGGDCLVSKQGRSRNLHKVVLYPTLKLFVGLKMKKAPNLYKNNCI